MLDRLAAVRPRTLLLGAVVAALLGGVLFGLWPMPQAQELAGGRVLDTRPFASGSDAAAYLEALGAEGRWLYAIMLAGDMVWTLVHGLTVAAAIAVGVARAGLRRGLRWLALSPLVAMVLDLVENGSILAGISAHPEPMPVPAVVVDLATGVKYIALGLGYVALVIALAAWWRSRGASKADAAVH